MCTPIWKTEHIGLVMDQDRVPHVVILPLPLSGHVKPMLTVAELLCNAGFLITFVNSDYNHDRLERVMDIPTFYNRSPGFRFVSISDGLPLDQPRLGPIIFQLFFNTTMVSKPLFWELLISLRQSTERSPPTCIIADGLVFRYSCCWRGWGSNHYFSNSWLPWHVDYYAYFKSHWRGGSSFSR